MNALNLLHQAKTAIWNSAPRNTECMRCNAWDYGTKYPIKTDGVFMMVCGDCLLELLEAIRDVKTADKK